MKDYGIDITIREYDLGHTIAHVEKNGKSMLLIFGLCDFVENMDFWGIHVAYGDKDGREGLIFENIGEEDIRFEIKQFMLQYDLMKYDPIG
jgi:hypothetical protein